ncbi:hypothetical protein CHLRE_01g016250v5 [Chlamydomonas reinhardtii]|uniref:MLO-like protein n=1 Tax=Chlamydomonas reinhardtii TaxID=3055 RepID=A0A2K3E5S3_CHLRE|nr:uncharacterized protein CHLRE_01g016250v5 [Chlamydomonas reinhardtii]PNW88142.1 hypothetical protein CHLRE_01g016250v5 [Chlamydomonas reinhardtii]
MSKDASEIVDTPGWQVSLLLLLFATVTLILEKSLHFLEHAFHNKRGLRTALHHVKEEVLFLGSISLLLSAFQEALAKICIPKSSGGPYMPPDYEDGPAAAALGAADGGGAAANAAEARRHLLLAGACTTRT